MKFGYVIAGVACSALTLVLTAAWPQDATAKEHAPGAANPPAGQAAGEPAAGQDQPGAALMMKAMMPGDAHKRLAALVGNWTTRIKSMERAGATPVESTGTASFAMIMDGRFLVENFTSKTPAGDFIGMGLQGYNNMSKEYEEVWVDNMSTGMANFSGTWDEEMQAFKWSGTFSNPMQGGTTAAKSIMKKISDTQYEYTMMEARGDKHFKALEIIYTKA